MPYRSHASASSTTTTLTCNKPTGTVSGDVLVAIIGYYLPTAPITPPSGWTLGGSNANGNNAGIWYYKVAGGSEPATYAWTFTGSDESHVVIAAYSGIDNVSPIDVQSEVNGNGDGGITVPGITMSGAGTLVFLAGSNAGYVVGVPCTPPSGMTERAEVKGASYGDAYLADQEIAAAGATGNKTMTATSGTNAGSHAAFLVGLKAASGGGGSTAKARRIQASEGARILR